mmetsp:Transcript_52588/g.122388  ORF Transcript_52588/g.122388 Transcript_52588/m.122388 type:complete len:217 (-) Transcript_52588:855-1505(-)
MTLLYSWFTTSVLKSTLWAATTMGASEELPLGSHFCSPVSLSVTCESVVLQQRTPARSEDRTPRSLLASILPARVIVPTVGSKPLPETLYFTPPDHMCTIVIFPSVRVPVLSLQMTDAEPNVSTAASFLTSTFFLTMEELPMEREMVTQSGMPSGIAATASVTEIRIMYSQGGFCGLSGSLVFTMTPPMMNTTMHTAIAPMPICAPSRPTFCCKGV